MPITGTERAELADGIRDVAGADSQAMISLTISQYTVASRRARRGTAWSRLVSAVAARTPPIHSSTRDRRVLRRRTEIIKEAFAAWVVPQRQAAGPQARLRYATALAAKWLPDAGKLSLPVSAAGCSPGIERDAPATGVLVPQQPTFARLTTG